MVFSIVFKNGKGITFDNIIPEKQGEVVLRIKQEIGRRDWIKVTHNKKTKHIQTKDISYIEEQ